MRVCPEWGGGEGEGKGEGGGHRENEEWGKEKGRPSCPPLTLPSPHSLTRGQGFQGRWLPGLGEDTDWTFWVSPSLSPRVLLRPGFQPEAVDCG